MLLQIAIAVALVLIVLTLIVMWRLHHFATELGDAVAALMVVSLETAAAVGMSRIKSV